MILVSINRINFDREFGKHRIGVVAGIEFKHEEGRNLYVSGYDFINDQIKEIAYVPKANISGSSNTTYSRSLSYLGQASYAYDNRYYMTVNARRQGFSAFGEYSRWAT